MHRAIPSLMHIALLHLALIRLAPWLNARAFHALIARRPSRWIARLNDSKRPNVLGSEEVVSQTHSHAQSRSGLCGALRVSLRCTQKRSHGRRFFGEIEHGSCMQLIVGSASPRRGGKRKLITRRMIRPREWSCLFESSTRNSTTHHGAHRVSRRALGLRAVADEFSATTKCARATDQRITRRRESTRSTSSCATA